MATTDITIRNKVVIDGGAGTPPTYDNIIIERTGALFLVNGAHMSKSGRLLNKGVLYIDATSTLTEATSPLTGTDATFYADAESVTVILGTLAFANATTGKYDFYAGGRLIGDGTITGTSIKRKVPRVCGLTFHEGDV